MALKNKGKNMLDVDVSVIRTFLTVMDTRSVTLAAEVLDSSTASISRALKKMRDAFNDPLFIRTKQGLEPTALAYNITPNLAQALNNINNAESLTRGMHQGDCRQTRLKLSMSPLLEFYLTHRLQQQHYPFECIALMTEIHDGDLTRDISRLRSRKIDLSFTPQKYADWMITNVPVFEVQPAVMCRNGHPRLGPGLSVEQLAQEEYLSLTMWPSLFEDDDVLNPHRKAPIYSSSSLLNLMMMVATSDYVLVCGKQFAQAFSQVVALQVLDHPCPRSMGTIYAHYHKSRAADPSITGLIDILRMRISG